MRQCARASKPTPVDDERRYGVIGGNAILRLLHDSRQVRLCRFGIGSSHMTTSIHEPFVIAELRGRFFPIFTDASFPWVADIDSRSMDRTVIRCWCPWHRMVRSCPRTSARTLLFPYLVSVLSGLRGSDRHRLRRNRCNDGRKGRHRSLSAATVWSAVAAATAFVCSSAASGIRKAVACGYRTPKSWLVTCAIYFAEDIEPCASSSRSFLCSSLPRCRRRRCGCCGGQPHRGAGGDRARVTRKRQRDEMVFNFGARACWRGRSSRGAPADLFLSADEATMDALATAGTDRPRHARERAVEHARGGRSRAGGTRITSPAQLVSVHRSRWPSPPRFPRASMREAWLRRSGSGVALAEGDPDRQRARRAGGRRIGQRRRGHRLQDRRADREAHAHRRTRCRAHEGPAISYPFALLRDAENGQAAMRLLGICRSRRLGRSSPGTASCAHR